MTDPGPVLGALADPIRRQLLDLIAGSPSGRATATLLATTVPVSRQAVVKHLAVLEQAGLVRPHRTGRENQFAIRPEPISEAARWLADRAGTWDRRLDRLRTLAESTSDGDRPDTD
jgi:DNA-binding transcriptional ArsR family regulator